MKRSRKPSMVSSASGSNLCQVELFLAQDSSSKARDVLSQCHLRSSKLCQSNGMESHALFPGLKCYTTVCDKSFRIPQIKWKCPPKFIMHHTWLVAAGEESPEKEAQKLREMRLLEAVHPRLSEIPPSPSVSLDIEDQHHDDSLAPVVPLIPIEEEEEEATITPSDLVASMNTSTSDFLPAWPQCLSSLETTNTSAFVPAANQNPKSGLLPDVGKNSYPETLPVCQKPSPETLSALDKPPPELLLTDLFTAASAAVTAIIKSREEGSMIDTDLLIKFLNEPTMIKKAMEENVDSYDTSMPTLASKPIARLGTSTFPKPEMVLSPMPAIRSSHHLQGQPTVTRMSSQAQPTVTKVSSQPQVHPTLTQMSSQPQLQPTVTRMAPQPQVRPTVTQMSRQPQLPPKVSRMSPQQHLRPAITRTSPHPGYMGVSVVDYRAKQEAPSVPLVGPEHSRVLTPHPSSGMEVGKMLLKPNRMQPNLHARAVQTDSFPATAFPSMNPSPLHRPPVRPNGFPVPSFSAMQDNHVSKVDYIKNLIREHGVQREESQVGHVPPSYNNNAYRNDIQNLEREFKPKIQRACMFFKSSKGCRNGNSCKFLHDSRNEWQTLEAPSGKRMNLGPEINGRV